MNVFLIPTWYPNSNNKLAGIFTYEQVLILANADQNSNFIVSLWGQEEEGYLNRRLINNLKKVAWYLFAPKNKILIQQNYFEIFNPLLNWTPRLPFGGISRTINVNKKNLEIALKHFNKIDIIHAHVSYPAGFIAYKLSKMYNIPYVITEHMGPFPFKNLTINGKPIHEIYTAVNNSNCTISVSPSLSEKMASFGLLKPCVIPNLVDEDLFYPDYESKNTKFKFLTVSKISYDKGIDLLLKAISCWKPDPNKIEFIIVGNGDQIDNFKKLSIELNISNLVKWVGTYDRINLPILFRSVDAFVLFSRFESFGIVYAEALASGIPIIATPCGGPEFFINSRNGILTNSFDINDLSNSLKQMYENYIIYNKRDIRNFFYNNFSKKVVAEKILDTYNKVLNNYKK
jgi:glycosyltransferase involved in cell wall biosynthesis